jgi:hypothetical protein
MVILTMGQEYNEKVFAIHTYHPSSMVCGWVLRATTSTLVVVGKGREGKGRKGWWVDMKHFSSSLSQLQIFSKSVVFFVEFTKDPSLIIIIIIFNPLWKVCTYLQDHTYPHLKQSLVFMFIVYRIVYGVKKKVFQIKEVQKQNKKRR